MANCHWCGRDFLKDNRYINENKKLGHKFYCSTQCQSSFKNKQKEFICKNPDCKVVFKRAPNDISLHNFCSRSCAATINNTKFPKRLPIKKKCSSCSTNFISRRRYCSVECKYNALIITEEEIIYRIREFCKNFGRIPLKQEFKHSIAARKRFGTWNNAIKVAGFEPNPVLFAKRQIANDGHVCDSLAEKIIDDWFYARNIAHEIHVRYPNTKFTADFIVNGVIIEFFGLSGELKRYDKLMKDKLRMIKDNSLKLISIYPKDILPISRLEEVLKEVLTG